MTITIFFVSLLGIIALFLSKIIEIKAKKTHFVSRVFLKGDEKIHKVFDIIIFKYNRYRNISRIFVFEFLPSFAYEQLIKMKDYMAKKYYSANEDFRGKRMLRSDGSVSFFLEKLGEGRSGTRNTKI